VINIPKEETIELRHVRGVIGEKENLPSLNARSTLASIIRSIVTKSYGVPQLIHLYGALVSNKTLTFAAGENNIRSLFSDGTYLYAGLSISPGKVVKIDLSTFTAVSTLTFAAGEDYVISLFSDGTYLYAGVDTAPGQVVKIDLATFTTVSTLTFAVGEDYIRSLFSDGTYLYAGSSTTPGQVVKIDLSTFTKVSTLTFAAGEDNVTSLFSDGTYLYAGLLTAPGKIIKVDLSTFTTVSTLTFAVGENNTYSLFSDGTYLYIELYTSPGKIIKVDLSTFTKVSTLTFAAGENNVSSMFSDGTYLYAGVHVSPGKVVRRYIIPSNDLHQRKISLINEQTHTGRYYTYPPNAAGVTITSAAGAYTKGDYTEIIPVDTILTQYYITGITISNMTVNTDYELDIATGLAAAEVIIATVSHMTDNTNLAHECLFPIPIKISSNIRISARSSDGTGSLTSIVKIRYKL